MELTQLKTFYTVAKLESFTKASEYLFLTQPAVSLQIKELEHEYKSPLFERIGKKIRLTPAGEKLLPYAESIIKSFRESLGAVEEACKNKGGRILVGATGFSGINFLPELIKGFKDKFPDVRFEITLNYARQIKNKILANEIDIGLLGSNNYKHMEISLLEKELFNDYVIVALCAGHKWAGMKSINPDIISEEKIIMLPKTTLTRQVIEKSFMEKGLQLKVDYEYESTGLIKRLVEQGLGITLLCRSEIRKEIEAGWLSALEMEDFNIKRSVSMIFHRDKPLSPCLLQFIDFLSSQRDYYQKYFTSKN